MAAHSCAMGLPMCPMWCSTRNARGATDGDDAPALPCAPNSWSQPCDPGAPAWPGGGLPHFASVVTVGRVPHVTDESSEQHVDADSEPAGAAGFDPDQLDPDQLDPDQLDALADAQRAMEEARSRLADVPAEVVVTNHVMGLYELAAIHLSADPPDLGQSAFAIDAVACLVDGLGDRLGDDADTMRDALNNIRLAFVQIQGAAESPHDAPAESPGPG